MRVRLIRPSYWTDADLHTRLSAEVREFYIGLWMEADDAGYLAWDPIRIGADLYPYRSLPWRRSRIERWIRELEPHVQILECGKHALIPALPHHQTPPRPSSPHQRAHGKCLSHMAPSGPMWGHVLEGKGKEGKGKERGSVPDADGTSTTSEFRRKIAEVQG